MKRLLVCATLFALTAAMFTACGPRQSWTAGQRQHMREILHNYRQMIYLDDLSNTEFTQFSDDVSAMLEAQYPEYTALSSLPAVADTVDMAVERVMAAQIKGDPRNIRHIYPYSYLVAQGVLPAGLDSEQQRAFYKCLSHRVFKVYTSGDEFIRAVMADLVEPIGMRLMQAECADELFGWTLTEIDIIEIE